MTTSLVCQQEMLDQAMSTIRSYNVVVADKDFRIEKLVSHFYRGKNIERDAFRIFRVQKSFSSAPRQINLIWLFKSCNYLFAYTLFFIRIASIRISG